MTVPHPVGSRLDGTALGVRHRAGPAAVLAAASLLMVAGMISCAGGDAVRVRLESYAPSGPEPRRVEIRAQVAGPLAGLRYKWFSVAGELDPQESERPVSAFTFAEGTTQDRVTVEVWRADRRVARHELDVRLDAERARMAALGGTPLEIEITAVPPYEPGGPDTRADIAGRVTGTIAPGHYVVLYARASEVWYIQPGPDARHPIGPDGRWESWTHTGTSYAALVVRPGFAPLPLYDVLPQLGPHVLARAVVEGRRP